MRLESTLKPINRRSIEWVSCKRWTKTEKIRKCHWNIKVMLTTFFDYRDEVLYQFLLPANQLTRNIISVMHCFCGAIRRKRLQSITSQLLVMYNAPPRSNDNYKDHFSKNLITQPPYSPVLTPIDFWLFPMLKRSLREHFFN